MKELAERFGLALLLKLLTVVGVTVVVSFVASWILGKAGRVAEENGERLGRYSDPLGAAAFASAHLGGWNRNSRKHGAAPC